MCSVTVGELQSMLLFSQTAFAHVGVYECMNTSLSRGLSDYQGDARLATNQPVHSKCCFQLSLPVNLDVNIYSTTPSPEVATMKAGDKCKCVYQSGAPGNVLW